MEIVKTDNASYCRAATPLKCVIAGYALTGWDKPFNSVVSDMTVTAVDIS